MRRSRARSETLARLAIVMNNKAIYHDLLRLWLYFIATCVLSKNVKSKNKMNEISFQYM